MLCFDLLFFCRSQFWIVQHQFWMWMEQKNHGHCQRSSANWLQPISVSFNHRPAYVGPLHLWIYAKNFIRHWNIHPIGGLGRPKSCLKLHICSNHFKKSHLPLKYLQYFFLFLGGLRYELNEVRKCIRAGKIESELASHNESLVIARIEDEIRRQIGVKYAEDD